MTQEPAVHLDICILVVMIKSIVFSHSIQFRIHVQVTKFETHQIVHPRRNSRGRTLRSHYIRLSSVI